MDNSKLIKELEIIFEKELKRRKDKDHHWGIYKLAFKLAIEFLRILLSKTHNKSDNG